MKKSIKSGEHPNNVLYPKTIDTDNRSQVDTRRIAAAAATTKSQTAAGRKYQMTTTTTTTTTTTLLLVDVQNDFHPGGSLAIPTADEDAKRIAAFINQHSTKIDRVVATMDSHLKLHIAHPCFWVGSDGVTHPQPFTAIPSQDVIDKKWVPRSDFHILPGTIDERVFGPLDKFLKDDGSDEIDLYKYAVEYTTRLEKNGRFQLFIWPEHCLIGSPGHCVVKEVRDALEQWSTTTGGSVEWVLKGQNLLTESYSAIEADVPVNKETSFNDNLHISLLKSDKLFVAGQASSHCVSYTTKSIVDRWPQDQLSQITLLTDCMSAVPGFEAAAQDFNDQMVKYGVTLKKSIEAFED